MMDWQVWEQRRDEMMREAHQHRLVRALRMSRKRRGADRVPGPGVGAEEDRWRG
jgi:hypothetical protein